MTTPEDGEVSEESSKERATWGNRIEFILSCCSYAVGLGAIWRFPYLVYRNGGGAFLIAYVVMYVLAGLPLFFMELAFGQYASEGPISIWKISPFFQGRGLFSDKIFWRASELFQNVFFSLQIHSITSRKSHIFLWKRRN